MVLLFLFPFTLLKKRVLAQATRRIRIPSLDRKLCIFMYKPTLNKRIRRAHYLGLMTRFITVLNAGNLSQMSTCRDEGGTPRYKDLCLNWGLVEIRAGQSSHIRTRRDLYNDQTNWVILSCTEHSMS